MRIFIVALAITLLVSPSLQIVSPSDLPKSSKIPTGSGQYYFFENHDVYTGYFQPRQDSESRIFYQMFGALGPAANGSLSARVPLVFWFNGGPGCSSQEGAWAENGPYNISYDNASNSFSFYPNTYTWNHNFHMVYVDQPVGVGFSPSFDSFYMNNSVAASGDFESFLYQFFEHYQSLYALDELDVYLTGESYAGHYIPIFAHKILTSKILANIKLKGVAIGDGWTDPLNQLQYFDTYTFSTGLADVKSAAFIKEQIIAGQQAIRAGDYNKGSFYFDNITGYIENLTNNVDIYNFREYYVADPFTPSVQSGPELPNYLNATLYVGFQECNDTMYYRFYNEITQSFRHYVEFLLAKNLQVLLYNGQNDIIVSTPGAESWINQMNWEGIKKFTQQNPVFWRNPSGTPGGTLKQYKNLHFAIVFNAGHMYSLHFYFS